MKHSNNSLLTAARLALPLALLTPVLAHAHAYIEAPKSRALLCQQSQNTGCGAIQYEPQSAEGPKNFPAAGVRDGKIASAENWRSLALDEQTAARWEKVQIKPGKNNFTWRFMQFHATQNYDYFITKQGWNPNQPLSRDSFELTPFCSADASQPSNGQITHTCDVPSDRSGYHVILGLWNVADTANGFYQVIDVDVKNDGITPPPAVMWNKVGNIFPGTDLNIGDKAQTRIFNAKGETRVSPTSITINNANDGNKNRWPKLLAEAINREQSKIKAGQLNNDGEIVPQLGKNTIFAKANSSVNRVEIDIIKKPGDDGGNPPPGAGPQAHAGADRTVVATADWGWAYKLDGSQSTGQGLSYKWESLGGPFEVRKADQATAEAIVPKNGTGETTFRLTITDKSGKQATATAKVIAVAPQVAITGKSSAAVNERVRLTGKANFQGTPEKPLTYQWVLSDASGKQIVSGSGQHWTTPGNLGAGNYTVDVTAQSQRGMRSATASHPLKVSSAQQPGGEGDAQCAAKWKAQSYVGGSKVTHYGRIYIAKWWAEASSVPGDPAVTDTTGNGTGWGLVWEDKGACTQ